MNGVLEAVLVGDRWRTFCRCSSDEFRDTLTAVLDEHGVAFDVDDREPSTAERFLYGSDADATHVTITDPIDAELTVTSVTADPVARTALAFVSRSENRDRATAGVCLVRVSPVTSDTRDALAQVMTALMARLERDPWDLADHPRFRLAVLQRYKIRTKWRYWSGTAADTEAGVSRREPPR